MRAITELQLLKLVSGGDLGPGIGYGAQADGFQPNTSAGDNGMGLFKDPLSNGVAGALVGGAGSLVGGLAGAAMTFAGGAAASGFFNGFGGSNTSGGPGTSNSASAAANSGS